MAGGQGSRLGYDGPKGTYNIGVNRDLFIFQILIDNLTKVSKEAGTWVPLYIMTSEKNDDITKKFFEEQQYFNYPKESIFFFQQDMFPSVDYDGKLFMEEKDRLAFSPNGNGGWFSSLVGAGLLEDINNRGIEWMNVFSVDNVLQQIADPLFRG